MGFLNSVEPQIKFTLKQLNSILIKEAPLTTDIFSLGIIMMIAHKKCKNKSVAVRNHYMDLQFNMLYSPASLGYQVLSIIDGWDGENELVDVKDVPTLRREFLVNILAF
ncbi:hypothetical protein ACP4OV_014692 [Aristida adscensionis]